MHLYFGSEPARSTLILLLTVFLPVCVSRQCDGQMPLKGNREWLSMAAVKYRDNLDRLRTWRGEVQLERQAEKPNETILVEAKISFAYSRLDSNYLYRIRETKRVSVHGGVEEPQLPTHYTAALCRDGVYHRVMRRVEDKDGPQSMAIQDKPFDRPAFANGAFLPEYFLTYEGTELDRMWQMYFDSADDPSFDGTISRDGDIVTLTRYESRKDRGVVYVFDLAKAGNPTRIERMTVRDGATSVTTLTWTWQKLADMWVPKKVTQRVQVGSDKPVAYYTTLTWLKSAVNEPLSDDQFSFVKMGMYRGDFVFDGRTNTRYRLEDAVLPVK